MSIVGSVAILAVAAFAASGDATADVLYATRFDYESDRNYDRWPDGWTRARGPRYPHYVQIGIVASERGDVLRIALDGGAAVVYAPEITLDGNHSYSVAAELATEGLRHDGCWLSMNFRAADGRTLASHQTRPLRGSRPWTTLALDGLVPPPDAVTALVGIHLEPLGEEQDLTGSVRCRALVIRQTPRLELQTSAPFHLHMAGEPITVRGHVRGVPGPNAASGKPLTLRWQLLSPEGKTLATNEQPAQWLLTTDVIVPHLATVAAQGAAAPPGVYAGQWQLPRLEPGYYRVRATLVDGQSVIAHQETPLAVLTPQRQPAQGTFTWTLPSARHRDALPRLMPLLRQAGIQRVKLPLWLPADDVASHDRVAEMIEELATRGIQVTGLIVDPPPAVRDKLQWQKEPEAIDLLLTPADRWFPSLAPGMTRLAMAVPKWQLGRDREPFVAELSDVTNRVAAVKEQAFLHGLDIELGIAWNWVQPAPTSSTSPWNYLVYWTAPPLAAEELPGYLSHTLPGAASAADNATSAKKEAKAAQPPGGFEVVLEPLDHRYDRTVRLADLVRRMVAAMQYGAAGVVVPDPFDSQSGLCDADGLPTELFVPWRTTSHLLGGARYLGSITLPGGSSNAVFERDGQLVMAVWSERATTETLWLGQRPRQIDIWGRTSPVPAVTSVRRPDAWRYRHVPPPNAETQTAEEHHVEVGPVPTFLVGLDPAVMRTRLSLRLAKHLLPAEFGHNQNNELRLQSGFAENVSGQVTLVAPDRWRIQPGTIELALAPGETLRHRFAMRPPFNAEAGRQLLALDFDITAGQPYRFRVYAELVVGADGLELELLTWLDEHGNLIVEQRLSQAQLSKTPLQCYLSVPGRRIEQYLATNVGPEPHIHRYVLLNGGELLGMPVMVRVEEQGGRQRVLQKRIVAEP